MRIFVVGIKDEHLHLLPEQGFDEHGAAYSLKMGNNTLISVQIGRVIATDEEKNNFKRRINILSWALKQPPTTAPITPEGDFDLQKLLEKEKTL